MVIFHSYVNVYQRVVQTDQIFAVSCPILGHINIHQLHIYIYKFNLGI